MPFNYQIKAGTGYQDPKGKIKPNEYRVVALPGPTPACLVTGRVNYNATGLPPGLSLHGGGRFAGLINGTPTLDPNVTYTNGYHDYTVSITAKTTLAGRKRDLGHQDLPMRKLLPFLVVFAAAANALAANPTITSINPSCAIAGGPQFTLTVNGTNYDNTSVVRWNGANLATTFVSSTKLTAIVPAANIATAGTPPVTVKNSTGSASNSVTFTIVAPPTISSLNPTCATAGGPGSR